MDIPGKYLVADLQGTDLLSIASSHPYIFWIALIVVVAVCAIYIVRYFARGKAAN